MSETISKVILISALTYPIIVISILIGLVFYKIAFPLRDIIINKNLVNYTMGVALLLVLSLLTMLVSGIIKFSIPQFIQ